MKSPALEDHGMAYMIPAPVENPRYSNEICEHRCEHAHCVARRAIAEAECFRCGEPIGYRTWLYHRRTDHAPAHMDCPNRLGAGPSPAAVKRAVAQLQRELESPEMAAFLLGGPVEPRIIDDVGDAHSFDYPVQRQAEDAS